MHFILLFYCMCHVNNIPKVQFFPCLILFNSTALDVLFHCLSMKKAACGFVYGCIALLNCGGNRAFFLCNPSPALCFCHFYWMSGFCTLNRPLHVLVWDNNNSSCANSAIVCFCVGKLERNTVMSCRSCYWCITT